MTIHKARQGKATFLVEPFVGSNKETSPRRGTRCSAATTERGDVFSQRGALGATAATVSASSPRWRPGLRFYLQRFVNAISLTFRSLSLRTHRCPVALLVESRVDPAGSPVDRVFRAAGRVGIVARSEPLLSGNRPRIKRRGPLPPCGRRVRIRAHGTSKGPPGHSEMPLGGFRRASSIQKLATGECASAAPAWHGRRDAHPPAKVHPFQGARTVRPSFLTEVPTWCLTDTEN